MPFKPTTRMPFKPTKCKCVPSFSENHCISLKTIFIIMINAKYDGLIKYNIHLDLLKGSYVIVYNWPAEWFVKIDVVHNLST